MRGHAIGVMVGLAGVACGGSSPTTAARDGRPVERGGAAVAPVPAPPPVAPAPPPPPLAVAPRLSLDANRPRAHVYDRGLVIDVAGSGLAHYQLAAKSAFGAATSRDGITLRPLIGTATLTVPWLAEDGDGAATITLRGRGPATVTVLLDGKPLGAATLPAAAGVAELAVPAGALTAGEHTLALRGGKALLASIELAAASAPAACPAGTARRVSYYGELPATAQLVARPTGAATVRVRVARDGAAPVLAYDGAAAQLPAQLPLGLDATTMARLDLEADGCASWAGAELAVLAAARPATLAATSVDNLVLIVIDTLRSDRLTAYGDTRVETPRLTALAARGAVFLHNQAVAPSSPPSHAAIHTGQIPRVHGVTGDDGQLAAAAPLLPALLGDAGFFTGFVGNNDFAMSRLRAAAGWDVAETPYYKHGKDCGPMVARAVELVAQAGKAGKRFFLSLLPIEPHVAYRFHAGVTDRYYAGPWAAPLGKQVASTQLARMKRLPGDHRDWTQLRALYDGEVTHVDACVGVLEDGLRAAGVLDRTAIIVTSDHGEGMGERPGSAGHAYSLNRELVDVPLIIAGGLPAARVDVPTSNADIAPTALALLGLPLDPRMQGHALQGDATDGGWPRIVASEYGRAYALRAAQYHLVVGYDGVGKLYDVIVDADERVDRGATAPIALRAMRDAAGLYLAHRTAWRGATWGSLGALAPGNPLLAP